MIWQNARAWLGLGAVALPVLIHLLGRGHARVKQFPTLRFLEPSKLLPTRRTRVHDLPLLLVRVAMLIAAVAALAQPLFARLSNPGLPENAPARAIVVDTSASMLRITPAGERAVDVARREADRLAKETSQSEVVETDAPRLVIGAAAAWLERRGKPGEVVVISDFQTGTVDSSTFARLSGTIGVRLLRIDASQPTAAAEHRGRINELSSVVRVTPLDDRTDAEWSVRTKLTDATAEVPVFAGPDEQVRATSARAAAHSMGLYLPMDTARARLTAIVTPRSEQRESLLRRSSMPRTSWMIDVIVGLRADSALQNVVAAIAPTVDADSTKGLVVARNAAGAPVVSGVEEGDRLLLFSASDPGSIASAMLIASVERTLSFSPAFAEFEPSVLSDTALASWQRPSAVDATRRASSGASDGRWLWAIVLLLLGVETWMRRAPRETVTNGQVIDRAA